MEMTDVLNNLGQLLLSGKVQVVDLAGVLGPDTPLLELPPDFVDTPKIEIHQISEYDDNGPFWAWNWLKLGEHSGTHFDAPHHWLTGKDYADGYTDSINPQNFIGPVNVIDCSKQAAADADFLLDADGVRAWEKEHGEIKENEWVLLRTDWYKRNGSAETFLNTDADGAHYPGPTVDCMQYLTGKNIMGWGSECIGTDAGSAFGMEIPLPAHNLLHKHNRYGLASLANLDKLPPKGAILIAAPLKIKKGTGSPVRALALVVK